MPAPASLPPGRTGRPNPDDGPRPLKHFGIRIEGKVLAGFESVRHAFAENFTRRHEVGGACCVYLRGEKVVDLWGGVRNGATGESWEKDTMVIVYSSTKGLSAGDPRDLALRHAVYSTIRPEKSR